MYVIAGLGNRGEEYEGTRHNAGRIALSRWVKSQSGSFVSSAKYKADIWEGKIGKEAVLAVLPQTFMNQSGGAVRTAVKNKADAEKLIVIYDDIDLPLGTIRISFDRGPGGHNGLRSVIDAVKTQRFVRIRLGISAVVRGKAKKPADAESLLKWVLGAFKKSEQKVFDAMCVRAGEAIECIIEEGTPIAMNKFNCS